MSLSVLSFLISLVLAVYSVIDRRHARFNLESQYWTEILGWYYETSLILKSLISSDGQMDQHKVLLAELSALIDKGRFYFPNLDRGDRFGVEKPAAFQGYRHLALEFLVASYRLHSRPRHKGHSALADELSRRFTSIVFEVVQPKRRFAKILSLTDHFYPVEKSIEDLSDSHDRGLVESIWDVKAG